MDEIEYEKMYSLEDTYWWFQGRKFIIFSLLGKYSLLKKDTPKRVIDLGCGTGLILSELNAISVPVGIDFSMTALSFCKRRGLRDLTCADVNNLPFADESFDLIFALDLLEHIKDDKHLLGEIRRICGPGGVLIATVPAHQYLWSEHDEALHHYRRYSAKEFHKLIVQSGFELIKYSFCISFMYFPIVIFRKLQKLFKPSGSPKTHLILLPRWMNSFLIQLLRLEAFLIKYINFPFGVSILCIARKK